MSLVHPLADKESKFWDLFSLPKKLALVFLVVVTNKFMRNFRKPSQENSLSPKISKEIIQLNHPMLNNFEKVDRFNR